MKITFQQPLIKHERFAVEFVRITASLIVLSAEIKNVPLKNQRAFLILHEIFRFSQLLLITLMVTLIPTRNIVLLVAPYRWLSGRSGIDIVVSTAHCQPAQLVLLHAASGSRDSSPVTLARSVMQPNVASASYTGICSQLRYQFVAQEHSSN